MVWSQVLKTNLKQNPGSDSKNQTQILLLGLKPILILELKDVLRWFNSWEESNKTSSPPLSMMKHKFAADLETKRN
jgi:hypothetical protein